MLRTSRPSAHWRTGRFFGSASLIDASSLLISFQTKIRFAPTLAQFRQYVEDGQIHYFIAADHKRGPGPSGHERGSGAQITEWVTGHFAKLDVGGATVYDLEAPH